MGEKPEFWDFYRAIRDSRWDDSYLVVRDKKQGIETIYYKSGVPRDIKTAILFILSLLFNIAMIFLSFNIDMGQIWPNLILEFILVFHILEFLCYIAIRKDIYNRTKFEAVPENEWNTSLQKRRKPHKAGDIIGSVILVIWMLFLFLNTYSFTYLRYLISGGEKAATVEVNIGAMDSELVLTDKASDNAIFIIKRDSEKYGIWADIDLSNLPGVTYIYFNGKELTPERKVKYFSFFWNNTFKSRIDFDLTPDMFKDLNTLEIRSGNDFYRSWTFAVKYE